VQKIHLKEEKALTNIVMIWIREGKKGEKVRVREEEERRGEKRREEKRGERRERNVRIKKPIPVHHLQKKE